MAICVAQWMNEIKNQVSFYVCPQSMTETLHYRWCYNVTSFCNIVSSWLSAYTKWTLKISPTCSTREDPARPFDCCSTGWVSCWGYPSPLLLTGWPSFPPQVIAICQLVQSRMIPHRWNNNWLYATTRGLQQYKIPLCSSIGYLCYLKFKFYKICYIDTSISILKSFWNFG